MTPKRIRAYATLIALTLWTIVVLDYAAPGPLDRFGKPKGTDFFHFYVIGALARDGRSDLLYDMDAQYDRGRAVATPDRETRYVPVESPQIAFAVAPFTTLPYTAALAVWIVVIGVVYGWSCWLMWTRCSALHRYPRETAACAVAFPGLYATVLHGQLSFVSLLAVCAALLALHDERKLAAGLALGTLVFKPHWVAAAAAVFLVAREWRVVIGIVAAAAIETGLTYLVAGREVFAAYWLALRSVAQVADLLEPRPGYSVRSLFAMLVPSPVLASALYVVCAIAIVAAAARIWRSPARYELRASAVVLAMVLISPHVYEYDLLLLAPMFFLLANAAAAADLEYSRETTWALVALFVVPLLTPIYAQLRVPLSVGAMSVVLFVLWRRTAPRGAVALAATG